MNNDVLNMVTNLKNDGITLKNIENELDFRDNSICRWDDNLYKYSTEELIKIEQAWNK